MLLFAIRTRAGGEPLDARSGEKEHRSGFL
jgi:hypothetical protein